MKNIPDRIYVQLPSNKWIGRTWDENPIKEGDNRNWKNATNIEYIRTDAFIEKACNWLRTHSEADYFELIPVANYCGAGNLNKKRMVEDFKKYMEE